ncbi:DUF4031 domain-containing protein [Prosthecomicrobium hirschii]|uniref:DUF4031 domain-containing protein n=1 Tax=Prosthecodimorpha hirschii TaxID=665126 RepID=UPI00221E7C38|nr:DUF4031 domain-containing protein [Prosthecomicrobium hirschii]MCW1839480.1 DUF4031 domain-containing protein [Prosthecomicrobium hirschii]
MSVYVDDVRHPYGRMVMCHMWADTDDELHAMAAAIGIRRRWFQEPPKASWKHYDIALAKKADAIRRGAILTDRYGPVEHTARLALASGDPDKVARARQKLDQIATIRARQPDKLL